MDELGVVCIHGAGLNSSIWDDLKKEIKGDVLAVDFPNRMGKEDANKDLEFFQYVDWVAQQIKNWQRHKFIIVAHSIGALVALKVAEHFKDELRGLVAIASVIPKSGGSFTSALPFPQNILLPPILGILGTKPPDSSIRSSLCNDLDAAQTDKIVKGFTPESKKLYTTKINFGIPQTNRLYIKTTKDDLSERFQDKMAHNFRADTVISLDSGHLPMLGKPGPLASAIGEFLKEGLK